MRMHLFPYLNQHDVIVERPRFVIIMSDDGRDWERLLKALRGVDAVLSQDHLHHAAPEGSHNRTGGMQIRCSGKYLNVTCRKAILLSWVFWLEFINGYKLWRCSYSRSPAVGGRHHPLGMDEGASAEVVIHEEKGGLVLDGVRLHHRSPNDSLPQHSWEPIGGTLIL